MSSITNVLLLLNSNSSDGYPDGGPDYLPAINAFFDTGRGLVDASRAQACYGGGNKVLSESVLLGCCNFLNLDAFVAHLHTLPWEWPDTVQLLVRRLEDERWVPVAIGPITKGCSDA